MKLIGPLAPKKLPDKLIYGTKKKIFPFPGSQEFSYYKIFSTKKSDFGKYAEMRCTKENLYPALKKTPYLYIGWIKSYPSDCGFGSSLLKFAEHLSKEQGCGGRYYLLADPKVSPNRAPHPFYRKLGMTTGDKYLDKMIDNDMLKTKTVSYDETLATNMYYPTSPYQNLTAKDYIKGFFNLFKF